MIRKITLGKLVIIFLNKSKIDDIKNNIDIESKKYGFKLIKCSNNHDWLQEQIGSKSKSFKDGVFWLMEQIKFRIE